MQSAAHNLNGCKSSVLQKVTYFQSRELTYLPCGSGRLYREMNGNVYNMYSNVK